MDNGTIEEVRDNETKLIQKIEELENINDKLTSALDSAEKKVNKIAEEFLKYDWKNSTPIQVCNQLKSLYETIYLSKEKTEE